MLAYLCTGKSTVLRLLLRFWDPTAGRVTIDGQNVARVTLRSLRAAIAVVPQDCVLFNESIGYNIAYGREGASREEVEQAAKVGPVLLRQRVWMLLRCGNDLLHVAMTAACCNDLHVAMTAALRYTTEGSTHH